MKLYYYKDKIGNFGDDLNVWLWDRLIPGCFDDDEDTIFVGIGTLLNSLLPQKPRKVVFSSGVGYKEAPPVADEKWDVFCVRGPLSAAKLGLDAGKAITDGAALLRAFDFPSLDKKYPISFVPHHHSHRPKWPMVCERVGIHYINPSDSVDDVFEAIRRSQLVVAESMHGAILADVFRVPWIATKLHSHILDFKWRDWCQSMALDYHPSTLPAFLRPESQNKYYIRIKYTLISLYIRRLAKRVSPCLSSEALLDSKSDQLMAQLDAFKKAYL